MGIKVTLKSKNTAYEGRFALNFKRERRDIASLLQELQKGKTLRSIFTAPVASAVAKKLNEQSYIDRSESVTATGEAFIKYPFFREEEKGIYSLTVSSFEYPNFDIHIATSMKRKLSETETELSSVSVPTLFQGNEFTFANDRKEIGVMESVELISGGKAYVVKKDDTEVVFDLSKGTYETDGEYKMGEILAEAVTKYVRKVIEKGAKSFEMTADFKVLVRDLKDFPTQDLLDGRLSREKIDTVELSQVPFVIEDLNIATQYAYLWLYDLLMKGNYYSLTEMSEIVQNEVSAKPIIGRKLRDAMSTISVSKDGFKKYLSQEHYEKLEYKLRIVDEYLGIESIVEDADFALVKDYPSLASYLADKVSSSDVLKMYMVMGYAFVKRGDNKIVECLAALGRKFGDITIVCKKGKTSQEEEPGLRDRVSKMGVGIVDKTGIADHFHDRYIIFEKKDGTYSTFLCTAEIGQIFHNGETKGSIIPIKNSDTVKAGKSLIELIKE